MRAAITVGLAAGLGAGCGDNLTSVAVALAPSAELIVVARPADDLLLLQPDLLDVIARGDGVTVVYLHAESAGPDAGLLAAYGHAAEATAWACGTITIADEPAQHCRLASPPVSLVFFDRPMPRALERIVRETMPSMVRTLEITGTHGAEAADRIAAGQLTVRALAATNTSVELLAYRGDPIADEPTTKLTPTFDAALAMLARYEACETGCAPCGEACTTVDEASVDLLLRRYAIGFRRNGGGRLRYANQCVSRELTLVSCPAAPIWTIDAAGELRATDSCITVGVGGALTIDRCLGGVERRWFVDDEGHILSIGSSESGLQCLTPRDGTVGLEACGESNTITWELVPDAASTPRDSLGLVATGRDVRLADLTGDGKADLCAVEAGVLLCAPGRGDGTFEVAIQLSPDLPIDARSLTLGDVDGDGRIDACGRNASGTVCATAASTFQSVPWTPAFEETRIVASTAASLVAVDADADDKADICGVDQQGLVCASKGMMLDASVRAAPLADDAVVWFADLDRDRQADWCTATEAGPACALWSDRELLTDGSPWGYAFETVVNVVPATTVTVALGDIDRDGRADLCSLRDDRIVCSRSQGRAFGPRTTLAILPNQTTASALWLGDLDGDGRADPCVDTGADIVCARQP